MIGRHLTHIPLFSGMLQLKRRAHIHVVLYTAFNLCCKSRIFRIVVGRRIYFFCWRHTNKHHFMDNLRIQLISVCSNVNFLLRDNRGLQFPFDSLNFPFKHPDPQPFRRILTHTQYSAVNVQQSRRIHFDEISDGNIQCVAKIERNKIEMNWDVCVCFFSSEKWQVYFFRSSVFSRSRRARADLR